jgi:elongation factor P
MLEVAVTTIRPGNYVQHDRGIYEVVSYEHVKPGKGGAFVRLKIKNLVNGAVLERTLDGDARVQQVEVEEHAAQFLFRSGETATFMNLETYDQIELPVKDLGGAEGYLKGDLEVKLLECEGKILSVKFPTTVELKVVSAPPGIKGDTASRATKQAELETGLIVNVPLFIEAGDTIRLDTRTGQYVERV